jgi:hypothetical protein
MADNRYDFRLPQAEIDGQKLLWEEQAGRYAQIANLLGQLQFRDMSSNRFVAVMAAHKELIAMYAQRAGEAVAVTATFRQMLTDLGTVFKRLDDEEAERVRALTGPGRAGKAR